MGKLGVFLPHYAASHSRKRKSNQKFKLNILKILIALINKWLLHLENDKYIFFKLDLPLVVSGLFSRLTANIVALKHVNNYYVSKYFIIIDIFRKRDFNFSFTIFKFKLNIFKSPYCIDK
jgi:hypothetical protein